jgi:hypothetical protein
MAWRWIIAYVFLHSRTALPRRHARTRRAIGMIILQADDPLGEMVGLAFRGAVRRTGCQLGSDDPGAQRLPHLLIA